MAKPSLITLIMAVVAAALEALRSPRDDEGLKQKIAEQKATIDALNARLAEEDDEDVQLEGLTGSLNELLSEAQAAKPPLPEHIEEATEMREDIPPAPGVS